jgi:hypothetical protein
MVIDDKRTDVREHHYYTCVEKHGKCLAEGHCYFCDGGLALCIVCRGAEGTLTSECSGRPLSEHEEADIMAGRLDYIDGVWDHDHHHVPHVKYPKHGIILE